MVARHYLIAAFLARSHYALFASATLRGNDDIRVDRRVGAANHRILQESRDAIFLIKDIQYDVHSLGVHTAGNDDRPNHTKNVLLPDGTIYEVKNAPAGWANNLKSGKYKVEIPPGAVISSDGTIDIKGKKLISSAVAEKINGLFDRNLGEADDASSNRTPEQSRNIAALQSHRQLQTSGTRTVLVVRVKVIDGAYDAADQTGLSNDVFGNGVDTYNLKSQYAACSYNQLIIEKSPNRSMTINPNDGTTAINNGVVDIAVALTKSAGDSSIRNAVTTKINAVFGVTSPDQLANHVMYCMPPGTMGQIAYAYPYSWNTVYSNDWCNYLSTQMHEVRYTFWHIYSCRTWFCNFSFLLSSSS